MWIQRTPEEITKWDESARRDAKSHGRFIGGLVWVVVSVGGAGGWMMFSGGGTRMVVAQDAAGSFWDRWFWFALLAAPFAYWVFRQEKKKELAKAAKLTICPQCDQAGENNSGVTCQCGGTFVPASTVKWVEK